VASIYIHSGRLTRPTLEVTLEVRTKTHFNRLAFNSGSFFWKFRQWRPLSLAPVPNPNRIVFPVRPVRSHTIVEMEF
jgi:hypothetical protein